MNFTKTMIALSVLAAGYVVNPTQALAQENKKEITKKPTDRQKAFVNAATMLKAYMEEDGVTAQSSAKDFLKHGRDAAVAYSRSGNETMADAYVDANREVRIMIEKGSKTIGDIKEGLKVELATIPNLPKKYQFSN